jgi:hypothetical protein
MASDDGFGFSPRRTGAAARGGGGGTSYADYKAQQEADEEDAERATVFKPGQTRLQEPGYLRGLPAGPITRSPYYSEHSRQHPGRFPPRYFDGDESDPGRMPPHHIANLQRLLVDAGLLDNPRWGFWDRASQGAYQTALAESNRNDVDVQTLLTTYADSAAMAEQEARGPYVPSEPLTLRTTHPDDLKLMFRDVSAKALGVAWTDRQIDELVNAYNWQEIAVQADAYSQNVERERQLYETGATDITQITEKSLPSPENYAIAEAKRRDPAGFQAAEIGEEGGYADAFFGALGGFG